MSAPVVAEVAHILGRRWPDGSPEGEGGHGGVHRQGRHRGLPLQETGAGQESATGTEMQAECWPAIRAQAAAGRVSPLLYRTLADGGDAPPGVVSELRRDYVHTTLRNRNLHRTLAVILAALHDAAIPIMLLKGAALAFAVYDDPGLRPMSDLDLLIRRADVEAAVAALAGVGYRVHMAEPDPLAERLASENELVLVGPEAAYALVELHWNLFDAPHYQRVVDANWLWQTALPVTVADQGALILGPEAQILHLCGHMALHHEGAQAFGNPASKLLWLADIAEVIHRYGDGIDWERLLQKAHMFDLVRSVQLGLGRVDALWPGSVPAEPLARVQAMAASPAEQQIFGLLTAAHRPTAQRLYADLTGLPDWRARTRYAARQLFPSPAYMGVRYALRRPWLLPFAYPYRWWVGVSGLWRRTA